MTGLVVRLRNHIEETGSIPAGARVLVGYSGGADSTFLLHALHAIGVEVVAGHLHHGQRPEADEEMRRCEEFAKSLAVPFAGARANVPKMAKEFKIGLEEAGRKARYEFLQKAAMRYRCDLIATAHTRDDHVETVLFNLARGCGMSGLTGIPARRGNVVRPALGFSREETRAYCVELKLWFHDDPANADPTFARSRIRLNVVPELRQVNEAVDDAVVRLSATLKEEDDFLNGMAAAALEQAEEPLNGRLRFLTVDCEVAFDRARLASLPPALLKRGLRLAASVVGGPLDHRQTTSIAEALVGEDKGAVTAEGGEVVVEWTADRVTVRDLLPAGPMRHPLTVPGETESVDFGWRFEARDSDPGDFRRERSSLSVVVDMDALHGAPHLRAAATGDSMIPLGMTGRRKLSDVFGEAGLTEAARRRLPLVCDDDGPFWAPGLCLADRVKVVETTRRAMELLFGPQSPGELAGSAT